LDIRRGAGEISGERRGGADDHGHRHVTPDFSRMAGLFVSPGAALAQSRKLVADGAAIVDVGAESTRPGHSPVPADEEWARLEPLLASLVSGAGAPGLGRHLQGANGPARAANRRGGRKRCVGPAARSSDGQRGRGGGAAVSSCITEKALTPRSTLFSDMQRFFERSLGMRAPPGCRSATFCSIRALVLARAASRIIRRLPRFPLLAREGFPLLIGVSRNQFFAIFPMGWSKADWSARSRRIFSPRRSAQGFSGCTTCWSTGPLSPCWRRCSNISKAMKGNGYVSDAGRLRTGFKHRRQAGEYQNGRSIF